MEKAGICTTTGKLHASCLRCVYILTSSQAIWVSASYKNICHWKRLTINYKSTDTGGVRCVTFSLQVYSTGGKYIWLGKLNFFDYILYSAMREDSLTKYKNSDTRNRLSDEGAYFPLHVHMNYKILKISSIITFLCSSFCDLLCLCQGCSCACTRSAYMSHRHPVCRIVKFGSLHVPKTNSTPPGVHCSFSIFFYFFLSGGLRQMEDVQNNFEAIAPLFAQSAAHQNHFSRKMLQLQTQIQELTRWITRFGCCTSTSAEFTTESYYAFYSEF